MKGLVIRRRHLALLAAPALFAPRIAGAAALELRAADGTTVFAESLAAETPPASSTRPRGTILLFHMAGSNLGEYATIAPDLARRGFATLAIDQRSGGAGWGRRNATAAQFRGDPGFRAALPDLEAALAWARVQAPAGPIIVWGSSYSAALVFLLAANAGAAVSGLLAFSPDEYLPGVSVRAAAARVTCPVFVTSDQGEEAAAASLLAATRGAPRQQFRPTDGAHGNAILRVDRNPRGAAAARAAVFGFLDAITPA